jgi:hypothetical protein
VKITEIAQILRLLFPRHFSTRNGFGYILGDFFTNTFGHPAGERTLDLLILFIFHFSSLNLLPSHSGSQSEAKYSFKSYQSSPRGIRSHNP